MRLMILSAFLLLLSSCLGSKKPQTNAAGQVVAPPGAEVVVEAKESSLSFDPQEIVVQSGQKLRLKVSNNLRRQDLNFLVLPIGDDPIVVSQLALQMSSEKQNWVLPSEDYHVAQIERIAPQQSQKLSFQVPDKEGVYYFVSTFPGQADSLQGKVIVKKSLQSKDAEENDSEEAWPQALPTDEEVSKGAPTAI